MSSNYSINGMIDPHGVETDRRAKTYAQDHGLSYADAVSHVVREQGQRRYATDAMWPEASEMNVPPGIVEAYRSLANVAADAGHDANEAARRINAIFDRNTIARAAQFAIERRKSQIFSNMSPGATTVNLQAAYRQVQGTLPATWRIYEGGGSNSMTPEACREMFMIKYSSSRTEVRRYSSENDHIRYDATGNQFRVYEFAK